MVTSFCEKRKRAKTYLEGAWVELTESYFLTDILVWPNRVNYYDLFIPLLGICPTELHFIHRKTGQA